ncbi:MAG: saccharopine dehydrogenase C-terminal domain-containing protein [Candidatus Cyclobacteriaceae bacterium M3_2C_046]
MKKVIVLGAGMVGGAIARDLKHQFQVTSADKSQNALEKLKPASIKYIQFNFENFEAIPELVKDYDLVIGAVPGHLGFKVLEKVIQAGKNVVDISFFGEDPFQLTPLALEKGVTAIVDCGVAPGMGNIILGHHQAEMQVSKYCCYVGGLPRKREWPFEYKAVFSPIDVIEEYTRPARYRIQGKLIVKPALSDIELINIDPVGSLEAWNSDGLRTLLQTMDVPDMIEKTLRYPGTIQYIKMLRDAGFFDYQSVDIGGNPTKPIDLTSKLLFDQWQLKPGEADLTIMKIIIDGLKDHQPIRYTYDLFDQYDPETDETSMARTTGYVCTAVANLMLQQKIESKGILPPELLAAGDNLHFILNYLKSRKVNYKISETHV